MTPSTSAYARLATSLKRALGPAGADGRLATDAAAAARRLAGVGAVRDPPAGGGGGGEGAASTSTTTPAGPPLSPAAAAALARDWSRLVDAVRVHQDLLTSYNIGVDRDSRQLEDVRKSAARVGLRLPPAEEE